MDKAIAELQDEGVRTDVWQLQVLQNEQASLQRALARLNNQLKTNQEETILVG